MNTNQTSTAEIEHLFPKTNNFYMASFLCVHIFACNFAEHLGEETGSNSRKLASCREENPDDLIDRPRALIWSEVNEPQVVELADEEFYSLFKAKFSRKYEVSIQSESSLSSLQENKTYLEKFCSRIDKAIRKNTQPNLHGKRDALRITAKDDAVLSAYSWRILESGKRANVYSARVNKEDFPEDQVGLFAGRDLSYGEVIGVYAGELSSEKTKRKNSFYILRIPVFSLRNFNTEFQGDFYVDSWSIRNEFAHVNHSDRPNLNWVRVFDKKHPYMAFIVNQDIPKDSHLTINYGSQYWKESDVKINLDHATPLPLALSR